MRVPKYYRVKEDLLALIDGAPPGMAIPTERDLAERFSTSRTTVRQAIAELVAEGRVERTQGRGTFVGRPKLLQIRPLTSFSQDLEAEGRRPGSIVLSVRQIPADADLASHLDVAPGAILHRVDRLRTVAGEPIAHEIAHVPGPLTDLEGELARRGSLYATLAEAYGRRLAQVEDIIETALADPLEADLLGVEVGLPMLLIHRTAWDETGRPIERTRSVFRGDRFRFIARHDVAPRP